MKYQLLMPLSFITILLFTGCEKSEEEHDSNNSPIVINQIEQNITNKETSLGCQNKNDNDSKECTEEEVDSTNFILRTLKRDLENQKESNIGTIRERLTISLKEIGEEANEKSTLKENLEALVNELSENKKKSLEDFVNHIDEFKRVDENILNTYSNDKKISTIKDELKTLISKEDSKVKSKVVKKRLERLIADATQSKKDLAQTEKSLEQLVKEVEDRNLPSVTKFANAIIEDVSSKKISIVKEDNEYLIIKVKEGDNLSLLAKRYYNNARKYKLIYEANKDKISSDYEIYPGSELFIPKI